MPHSLHVYQQVHGKWCRRYDFMTQLRMCGVKRSACRCAYNFDVCYLFVACLWVALHNSPWKQKAAHIFGCVTTAGFFFFPEMMWHGSDVQLGQDSNSSTGLFKIKNIFFFNVLSINGVLPVRFQRYLWVYLSYHDAHYVNNLMMNLANGMVAIECVFQGVEEEWRCRASDDTSSMSRGAVHVIAAFQYLRAHVANHLSAVNLTLDRFHWTFMRVNRQNNL